SIFSVYHYLCIHTSINLKMTKTAIISFDSDNEAVQEIIDDLIRKGVIKIEEYPYNQTIVEKIKRGERAIEEGKGIAINPDNLWK
ncbi:MAG: DUF2683 family protein, partial [Mariniphaga sp.]